MPIRHGAPLGAPTWIELSSSDVEGAQRFYGAVFGWSFESAGADYGGYVNAFKDGRPIAGLMSNDPQWNAPDGWTTYFHTADVHATVAAARAAGGANCVAPMEVKSQGWMAMLTDPSGAFFGLWQPLEHHGYQVVGEPGAPVWHQLTTRDFAGALDFYRTVFGWQTQLVSDSDEFRYATASFDGTDELGVMDGGCILPADTPPSWNFFLGAEDVDKTLEVVVANGGTVVRDAEDTPYGRLAAAADPTGAPFNLSSVAAGN